MHWNVKVHTWEKKHADDVDSKVQMIWEGIYRLRMLWDQYSSQLWFCFFVFLWFLVWLFFWLFFCFFFSMYFTRASLSKIFFFSWCKMISFIPDLERDPSCELELVWCLYHSSTPEFQLNSPHKSQKGWVETGCAPVHIVFFFLCSLCYFFFWKSLLLSRK